MSNVIRLPVPMTEESNHLLTPAERRIRDAARYINRRIANLKAGEAWLDVGRELAELKAFLVKHSKNDDTREGWKAAFAKGVTQFSFSRQYADMLIQVHETLGATAVARRNLPASMAALRALSRLPESHRAQAAAKCSPGTTEREVREFAREAGCPSPKRKKRAAPFPPDPRAAAVWIRERMKPADVQQLARFLSESTRQ